MMLAFVMVTGASTGGAVAVASSSQAPEASIRVTPATDLIDGQVVEVEVTGLSGEITVGQCDPDNVPGNTVHCRTQRVSSDGGPSSVPFTVEEEYETNYRGDVQHTRCGGIVDDCLMVAFNSVDPRDSIVTAPIHFGPPRPDPALTVSPSSGLHHGDGVQIEVVGLGTEDLIVAQCEREDAAALPEDPTLIYNACRHLGTTGGVPADPFAVSATVSEAWTWDGTDGIEAAHCGPAPGGCVIVVYGNESGAALTAPIDVEPSPLAVVPDEQEAGFPVHVFVAGRPGARVKIAQCVIPVRRTTEASRCGPRQSVSLDETGDAATTVMLVEQIVTRGHRTVPCATDRCAVALFTARGATIASSPVVVYPPDGPPTLSVDPTDDLVEGQFVDLTITGTRNTNLRWAQCHASVVSVGRLDGTLCGPIAPEGLGHDDPELLLGVPVTRMLVTEDGSTLPCGQEPDDCVMAIDTDVSEFAAMPISFTARPVVTPTPTSGPLPIELAPPQG